MSERARRRVVLAPDKFKGTLSARDVVAAMRGGVPTSVDVEALPIADGGDGSVEAALSVGWQPLTVHAVDAWGAPLDVLVACDGKRAIVEVATVCGLGSRVLSPREALTATSYGVGIVIRDLLSRGVTEVTLALGGSATTDAGTGMLRALGFRFSDGAGNTLGSDMSRFADLAAIEDSGLEPGLHDVDLILACDVDSPMVGRDGSAEVFGPQKGADPETVALLARALARIVEVMGPVRGRSDAHVSPGSGAAGGLAWGGLVLGGRIRAGAATFLELLGAESTILGADLVITGEGRLDHQTLRGKAPVAVAELARRLGVSTAAIVGSERLDEPDVHPFVQIIALDRLDPTAEHDLDLSRTLIARAVLELVERHVDPLRRPVALESSGPPLPG